MMKFDKCSLQAMIDHLLASYPGLFRLHNREQSELLVLAHAFISYGTELEWHPDGYLCEWCNGYKLPTRVKLPLDFFEANVFEIDVNPRAFAKIKAELGKRFYMRQPGRSCGGRAIGILVRFLSQEQALSDIKNYSEDERARKKPFVHSARAYGDINSFWFPDNLSEYSPLCEMLNGTSNNGLDLCKVRRDWIDGCLRIARVALSILGDPAKHSNSCYYPSAVNYTVRPSETQEQLLTRARDSFAKTVSENTLILERFITRFSSP